MSRSSSPTRIDWSKVVKPENREPSYDERVAAAMREIAPVHVLLKEIILAMNHAQLSGKVNWSAPMDARINQVLRALERHNALERPK